MRAGTIESPAAIGPQHARNAGREEASRRAVAVWLLACAALVFVMVVVGGITRLTHSGLSIVEWQPIVGALPPFTEAQWLETFAKYQQTPEYKLVNHGMSLAEFKGIFWWEYVHRLLGRAIGLVFLVPLLWFAATRRIDGALALRLGGIFVLGALQGAMGWYMVKSGLVDDPRVSQFRLTAHLLLAFAIFAAMLWTALGLLYPQHARGISGKARSLSGKSSSGADHTRAAMSGRNGRGSDDVRGTSGWSGGASVNARGMSSTSGGASDNARGAIACAPAALRRLAWAVTGLVAYMAVTGGFVAGIRAGKAYNTFPLMNGHVVPPEFLILDPWWKNFFYNMATVQFDHRLGAWALVVLVPWLVWSASREPALSPRARSAVAILAVVFALQFALGVATVLTAVPVALGAAHQGGAVLLLAAALVTNHALRDERGTGAFASK